MGGAPYTLDSDGGWADICAWALFHIQYLTIDVELLSVCVLMFMASTTLTYIEFEHTQSPIL